MKTKTKTKKIDGLLVYPIERDEPNIDTETVKEKVYNLIKKSGFLKVFKMLSKEL